MTAMSRRMHWDGREPGFGSADGRASSSLAPFGSLRPDPLPLRGIIVALPASLVMWSGIYLAAAELLS
jgi:hypothetical protein